MSETQGPTEPLILADVAQWREWLTTNDAASDGVWLLLAKKGVTSPTSLTYPEALEEALCSGWIDGRRNACDDRTYVQRFTPRRARSLWSLRNVEIVARLADEGRLRPRGLAEIERARSDGRWDRAYPGQAAARPPEALVRALDAAPAAAEAFARLSRSQRFSALLPLLTAPDDATLDVRIRRVITDLSST